MKYLIIGLTLAILSYIIIVAVKKGDKYFAKVVYRQSDIHQIVKNIIPKDLFELPKPPSQARKHINNNMVRVIVVDGQAYWIHNNMFFTAETVNGSVNPETTKPVDTSNMSKRDIDKMLFIVDSLRDGNSNDSGSAWNK